MENIHYFHLATAAACLAYYFKFSEIKLDFFEECYKAFRVIKSQMTGEIAKELENLSTPIPDLYVNATDNQLEYRAGNATPWKSEKFKNWLDSYLGKELNLIVTYHKFTILYKKWQRCWSFLKHFSIFFAIFEFALMATSFYLNSTKSGSVQNTLFSVETSSKILFATSCLSVLLIISALFLLAYTERLKTRLIKSRDHHNGL